jgi:predicted Zn-dependent peptidase
MRIFAFILCLTPLILLAQPNRSVVPSAGPAPIINIPDAQQFTLPNGLTVVLSENHKIPRVSIEFYSGSDIPKEGEKAGLREFTGSLILSGTSNRTKDQLDAEKDYFGASINTSGSSSSMSCLKKHLEKVVPIFTDVMMNASFPEDEFLRIKDQYLSNLMNTKSDPGEMANNATYKVNFEGHPFGEIMTENSLNNISLSDIQGCYKQFFSPDKGYLIIVGDISLEEAKSLVNSHFASWSGAKAVNLSYPDVERKKGNQVYFVNKPGAVQSVIQVSYTLPIRTGNDQQLPLGVLNNILGGGGFGTRLMQNLREKRAFTYGCYSDLNVNAEGSWLTVEGNFRNEVSDSAITEILYEMGKLIKEPVKAEELSLTKNAMAGGFARSLESPSTVARFAYNIIRYGLKKDIYQTYLKRLDAINSNDIQSVSTQFLTASQCNIVVVGNESIVDNLKQFDSDGSIDFLDAFGNIVEQRKPADISKEVLLEKYILAVTGSKSKAEAVKKCKKIKSFEKVTTMKLGQASFKSTEVWMAPNLEGNKLEGQGMVFQKSYFDGKRGESSSMEGKKPLSETEVKAKMKITGLFPELNYEANKVDHELLGVEKWNGKEVYVLKLSEETGTTFDYYDKNTFMKLQSVAIRNNDGQAVESTIVNSNFKPVQGIYFPFSIDLSISGMSLAGTVETLELNKKVNLKDFK